MYGEVQYLLRTQDKERGKRPRISRINERI